MTLRFDGRVVVITGAGGALGSAYARELAWRGARLVLNDMGTTLSGALAGENPLVALVSDLRAGGAEVVTSTDDLSLPESAERIVHLAMSAFGRIDALINNAGIMRNGAFKNMSDDDFSCVFEVHVSGTARLTREVFRQMITQGYGRILMTTSAGGLYGAFGVANYAAAKLAQIGLMNVLAVEGARDDIRVNAVAPIARSRMLDGVVAPEHEARLIADWVVPAAVYLVSPACCRSGDIIVCGGGHYAKALLVETGGVYLGPSEIPAVESFASMYDRITDAGHIAPLADVHDAIRKALSDG